MGTRKTNDEVIAEAQKLADMKPSVRQRSNFGDDHHDAIEAQIRVLREGMTEDDIYTKFGDESRDDFAQNVLDEALYAHWWVTGAEEMPASTVWKDLVQDNAPRLG